MRSQPLPGEASHRPAEEQFKTTRKIDYQPDTSTAASRNAAARMIIPSQHTPQYYLERAVECERLADKATTAETRETMLYLAMRWRTLAEEHTSKQTSSNGFSEPENLPGPSSLRNSIRPRK